MRTKLILGVAVAAALLPAPAGASPIPVPPELWVMSSDGTDQRQIATIVDEISAPSWSPDGSRLVFTTQFEVTVADASGDGTPQGIGRGARPAWSPDGRAIAFIRMAPDEPASLAVMDPDGSDVRVLAQDAGFGPVEWSPDGSRIAFSKCDYDPEGRCYSNLAVIRSDGADERVLAAPGSQSVSWSPDGSSLVYANGYDLYVLDVSSGTSTDLTPGPGGGGSPDWGPDGRIAYAGFEEGTMPHVSVVDPDGTDRFRIHAGSRPRWSPDGSRIVFVTYEGIRVVVVGTEGAPLLTPGGHVDFDPQWSPGGESIAYYSQQPFTRWPDYARSVSVSVSERRVRVHVGVDPGGERCLDHVPVRLQRRSADGWHTEERGRTDERGRARWPVGERSGIYRVRVPERYAGYPGDSPRCLKATSPRFRLGG